ncbi:MAG: hypothetical protein U0521_16480 [Anaerolineae bacterium]
MQDNTLVILGMVGLALVCAGLFVFVGLTLFRATGHRLLGFFSLLARDADNNIQSSPPPSVPDLRAIARAQDFDTALARHGAAPVQPPQAPPADGATALSATSTPRVDTPRLGTRQRRDVHHDEDDAADLFDALLDEDP